MKSLRRLAALWCLAAFLTGEVAQASVIIVYEHNAKVGLGGDPDELSGIMQNKRNLRILQSIIRTTGGDYTSVARTAISTQNMRRAKLSLAPFAATGSDTLSFDAAIWIGSGGTPSVTNPVGARADSMGLFSLQNSTFAQATPAKPFLLIRDNTGPLAGSDLGGSNISDSLGCADVDNGPGKSIYEAGDPNPWMTHAYVSGAIDPITSPIMRKILFSGTMAYDYRHGLDEANTSGIVPCVRCDSVPTFADSDTLILWDMQFNSMLGHASTVTVVNAFGAGAAADSIANAASVTPRPPTEGDFSIMLAGLAHLDSLVRADGGRVLGDKKIRIAPVVYGALARGERAAWLSPGSAQGIFPPDTSSFYAALDSLASWGIPITFAVNVDSASSYERDIIKLKQVRGAKFTPQVWTGADIDTTTIGVTNNGGGRIVDVFGRYRKRSAMGAYSVNDTSVYSLARRALWLADSIFNGRVSRVAVAPDDDWSPKNVTGFDKGGVGIDSVLFALQEAGYVGVVSDAMDPDASASKSHGPSRTNPRGYYNQQGVYNSPSIASLRDFRILTHTGYAIHGGARQATAGDDSLFTTGGWIGLTFRDLSRVWSGALLDFDDSYDTWAYDNFLTEGSLNIANYANVHSRLVERTQAAVNRPVVRGNIYRLSCADLSGVPNGPPAMNGLHVLKSLKNAFRKINQLAGRDVIDFAYPEDIEP